MRIGLALHTLNPASGGVASATIELALGLQSLGHSATLICLDAPNASFLNNQSNGLPVVALGPSYTSYGFTPLLAKRLQAHSFDALVLNGLWQYSSLGMVPYAQKAKIPYIVFPHGMLDEYFKRFPLKHLKKQIYWNLFEQRVLENAQAVCYTTESEKLKAQNTFRPFRPRKEVVIGLGLRSCPYSLDEAKETFFKAHPALQGKPYILFLSRLHPKKGLELLLQAHRKFSKVPLVVAGPSDSAAFLAQLKTLAGANVTWIDLLTGPAKWGALAAAKALFLTSHQENFGMVVAEALSVGTPAFVSNQVAIAPDILAHHCGAVAPDTLSGAEALLQIFATASPTKLQELRQNAFTCYQTLYTPQSVARRLLTLLQNT